MVRSFLRKQISEIQRYRVKIAVKKFGSRLLSIGARRFRGPQPRVTIFVVSANNCDALRLTLESLLEHTSYANFEIWAADNNSTDGSLEYLEELERRAPLKIIRAEKNRTHPEWLDWASENIDTPLWVGIDNDLYFLGSDWLADMVRQIERDPAVAIVGGEKCAHTADFVEPVSGKHVELAERFSAYLFIMRTSLRSRVSTSFQFVSELSESENQQLLCYDTGGKLMADALAFGLRCEYMPGWFWAKWHHIGSLSWAFSFEVSEQTRELKRFQLQDIKAILGRGRY